MIRPVAADGRIETGGAFTPIHRPRIVERIESAATQRIVLIVAPAGYGKSVALQQHLETAGGEYARYDLHAEHGSLLGFVRGFADAVLAIAPDARKNVSIAYEKSCSSRTPGVDLAMWMHAHIKAFTGTIAIDDLHIAENDPEISRFLVSLVERTKGRTRWIIASRSSLDLPVGSWLAYGEMDLNIDEQDLRFTLEEARQAAKASRVGVRDEELEEILALTEGWPTALSFALRSSTRSVDLRNISASTREMVYRYLAEQVYESLDADERELLHFIGYLPEIDLDVLKRAGYEKAKAVVETLRDRVAFIYPDRPGVYRCHDLFRAFLQHQVELAGDATVELTRMRVARALEECLQSAAALRLYAEVGATDDLLRLLERFGFDLMDRAHEDAVSAAVNALPQEIRATHPVVLGLRAAREADGGRFDRAESLFERAIQRSVEPTHRAELATRLGTILFNQGKDVIGLLEPLMGQSLPDPVRAKILSWLTPAYARAERVEDAHRAMEAASQYAKTVDSDELRARLLHRMGIAALTLGLPLEQVTSLFGQAHSLANEQGLFVTAAAALGGLATVSALYEDDVAKYVWYAQQAVNAAAKAGDRFSMQTALLMLINAEAQRGNLERLVALDQQFASVTTSDSARVFYVVPARAMMAAWQGRFEDANRQLSSLSAEHFFNFDRVFINAMHSLYAVASGSRDRAIELTALALQEIQGGEFEYLYGRRHAELARLICAITEAFAGRVTNSQRILARRPIVEGPPLAAVREAAVAICRMMKSGSPLDEAVEALTQMQAVGYGGISRVLEGALRRCAVEPAETKVSLTKAEIDVLKALGHGLTPKDIAQETGRSVHTIQAHLQSVIRKLGCSGRQEALSMARKQGILR